MSYLLCSAVVDLDMEEGLNLAITQCMSGVIELRQVLTTPAAISSADQFPAPRKVKVGSLLSIFKIAISLYIEVITTNKPSEKAARSFQRFPEETFNSHNKGIGNSRAIMTVIIKIIDVIK